MYDYGKYHANASDAFWGARLKFCKDMHGQVGHARVRDSVMRRGVRLERYLSRAEGERI